MTPTFFVGIDISKLTLDVAILQDDKILSTLKIENTEEAVRELLKKIKAAHGCTIKNTFFCAENSGLYHRFLSNVLVKKRAELCLDSPLRIKRSMGIQRGKNDKVDAIRIARYAQANQSSLVRWLPPREEIEQLRLLSALRKRLVKTKTMFLNNNKLEGHFLPKEEVVELLQCTAPLRLALDCTIREVEQKMDVVIQSDERLANLMRLITSIPHVGKIIGIEILIHTNEFRDITTPRKFASYCGIAPFERTSGTSLRGKARVSPIANREMKAILHLAALGYTQRKDTPIGKYYLRKVAEGKHKMSVLNAVRNKIVHNVYACVRDNKMFQKAGLP